MPPLGVIKDAVLNGNGSAGKVKSVASILTGPLGSVALAVWLLQWFMTSYQTEQAQMRATLKEVVDVTESLQRVVTSLEQTIRSAK